jgi:hypothetical protein
MMIAKSRYQAIAVSLAITLCCMALAPAFAQSARGGFDEFLRAVKARPGVSAWRPA